MTAPPPAAPPPQGLRLRTQLLRFVATGALSAVVDLGLLLAGMAAGLAHTPAKALSWVAGTLTAYSINRVWTFEAAHSRARLAAVAALYLTTFAVQVGLFSLLFGPLERGAAAAGLADHATLVAQVVGFVIAQGVATVVNFVVQRTLIFRS